MRRRPLVALLVMTLLGASCGSGNAADGELLIFAAGSLTDAFAAVAAAYEATHPDTKVTLSFASSSSLRDQILEGAPADVFASANTATMNRVVEAGAAAGPANFASNELRIAVPPGNPAGITGLADFGDDDLLIGLCVAEAPWAGSPAGHWRRREWHPPSTPTSRTCGPCSPRSRQASSTPGSSTAPT